MRKKILLFLLFTLFSNFSFGQDRLWTKVSEEELKTLEKFERATKPSKFELYTLNFDVFKQILIGAPKDSDGVVSNLIIQFPNAEGLLSSFRVYEAPIMDKELANKYPNIKSYSAQGIDDKSASLRFSVTLFGLHVMSLSGKSGTYYIDTYTKNLNNYIVYSRKDIQAARTFGCLVQDNHEEVAQEFQNLMENQRASDGFFRQYRLAMACTIEYANFHVQAAGLGSGTLAQKKAAVLAAMNVTMTRVNGVYERDMSLRMNFVANNDAVIFIDSDSFDNDNAGTLINQSQTVIDANIGLANYDIGHTVSTGGGGLAQLNSPCTNSKARGITGSPSPVGDPFDIDYVAHEIGHQFGANHTFNNSCGNNRNNATAVEPGSGSTIMAYAGICAPNVQNNSDSHFHAVSIAEMSAFVAGVGNCAASASNGNSAPVVSVQNYTIPYGTAFILKGSATDSNGDSLTYCWEQTNTQISTQPPLQSATTGPNFRSNPPTTSPNRYMPAFSSVLEGNLTPTWEVVPSVARTMNFALTVRDNRMPNGGQTGRGNMTVTFANVGPFRITSPSVDNVSWNPASTQTISWDVAGTTANGINTSHVNILFSDDNGASFTTLIANTPNDGSEVITLPNVSAPYCRIMIEAVDNIFYALSKNFSLGYLVTVTTTCNTYSASPAATIVEQSPLAYQTFSVNVPSTPGVISDVNVSVNISHRVNQLYLGMNHPDLTFVQLFVKDDYNCLNGQNTMITTFDDSGVNFNCGGAAGNNIYRPTSPLSTLNGKTAEGLWRFRIADVTSGVSGTLNSFAFNICTTETVVTLNSDSFGLQDFVIYPNPNSGNFNVQFSSNSGNEIKVLVHDIRGRQIFERSFNNSGLFNENINLSNVQSGIYMVTVLDGAQKQVKKIVVE